MSKPQSAAEPSMEDILASIRKMISEERLGPRPLPDQMSRTPFGETASAKPAEPVARGGAPEKSADPLPEPQPVPSFSSLSDALKAASKPSVQHRTLDEKIADMLDKGPAPAAPNHPVASDPLAVFAAARPARSLPSQSDPGSSGGPDGQRALGRSPDTMASVLRKGQGVRPIRDEAPIGPSDGAAPAPDFSLSGSTPGRQEPKPADLGTVVPISGETPAARRDFLSPRPASGPATAEKAGNAVGAEAKKPDDKTVISIPTRGASASGSTQAGTPLKNGAINGGTVAPFGPRPLPGSAPSVRAEDQGASRHTPVEDPEPLQPSLEEIAKATRPDADIRDVFLSKPAKAEVSFDFLGREPPAEALTDKAETADAPEDVGPAADAQIGKPATAEAPVDAAKTAAEVATGDVPKVRGAPSEALVDAVVDMVHAEPSSLSVFTSGSAFINGVGSDPIADDKPKDPRKLDRAAAELLRPMLRQWLAENMPRIVEEALRSELDSAQSTDKDADKA